MTTGLRLTVSGAGYLGITHAACMASLGFEVLGVDTDADRVAHLNAGRLPIREPGLPELLDEGLAAGRLRFTTSYPEAADFGDVHFICTGTPQLPGTEHADLSQVWSCLRALAPLLRRQCLMVGRSTVPVGTARELSAELADICPQAELAWNPEFLRESTAVADTLTPQRIVAGVASQRAENLLREVYARPIADGASFFATSLETAELAKAAANSFLATKISFINAIAEVCEAAGGDIRALSRILGTDPRIGPAFLQAGLGFGGGCLPKDIRAFCARAEELGAGHALRFLREVDAVNLRRRARVVELALQAACRDIAGTPICVLGASFKPGTDDIRDSPALDVARILHGMGAQVTVCDPAALANARRAWPELRYAETAEQGARGAHAVLLLTEWPEFTALTPAALSEVVARRVIIDGRNALDPSHWRGAGWEYWAPGVLSSKAGFGAGTNGDGRRGPARIAVPASFGLRADASAAEDSAADTESASVTRPGTTLVVGLGYVGLPLALLAAEAGHRVIGYDIDHQRVKRLEAGESYVDDVSDEQLKRMLDSGSFRPSAESRCCAGFDVAIITVPTPLRDGLPDLTCVESAARTLARYLRPGATVIVESTSYPGTTTELVLPWLEDGSGLVAGDDFHLGYSPERIDPGNNVWTLANTPKIIAGINTTSLAAVQAFYESFVERTVPVSSPREAELAKLIENTFRHVNIALVNELAMFAHELDINVWEAIDAASSKPFGFMPFTPGPGVGGHCLPIDPSYLSWRVESTLGQSFRFVELANDINNHMPDYVVHRLVMAFNKRGRPVSGSRVLLLGLAYKKNTGDARESPAARIAQLLSGMGADVRAADPHVVEASGVDAMVARVDASPEEISGADAVILLTDHDAFDLAAIRDHARYVLDCRRVLSGAQVETL